MAVAAAREADKGSGKPLANPFDLLKDQIWEPQEQIHVPVPAYYLEVAEEVLSNKDIHGLELGINLPSQQRHRVMFSVFFCSKRWNVYFSV